MWRPKKIDCSTSESELIQASIDWINDHPEEIEAQMAELWPNQSITAEEIIDSMQAAKIACGQERGQQSTIAGEARLLTDTIIIDVGEKAFQNLLDKYETNQWVEGANLNEAIEQCDNAEERQETDDGIREYYEAVSYVSDKIAHEAVHLVVGGHTKENEKLAKELASKARSGDYEANQQLQTLDEIYAWGTAAERAVKQDGNEARGFNY
ncbi:MAG: hypothetical protein V1664_04660 [Candidatus Uhrbacteria bacterium]